MRVFDVMGCGGVLLSEWQPDLVEWFEPDEHLATYRNSSEMVSVAERLLAMPPTKLESMGQAARRAVLGDHRLPMRVDEMLRALP
jgi:spore maturation protein CgeB